MKRFFIITLVLIASFVYLNNLYAQDLKIVDIKGEVLLRPREISTWREAVMGEILYQDYELQTKENSECTISFDDNLDKVLTLKENTQIKIEDIINIVIKLSKGRVFSLLENMGKEETFQIRTPTAVAGPRGTGLKVEVVEGTTFAVCYDGKIYVGGLDKDGNLVFEEIIGEGTGAQVFEGKLELFELTDEDKEEWNRFMDFIQDLKDKFGEDEGFHNEGAQNVDEMRDEQRDDFREEIIRQLRKEKEDAESSQQELQY
ncbi:MAG: FecR family protein [Candidatus Omnitrophota bacterium]